MSLHPIKKTDKSKAWMRSRDKRPAILEPPEYHLIVTEGTKTEPKYFEGLRQIVEAKERGLYRGRITISGQGTSCLKLLEDAEKLASKSETLYNHIWLVYDQDDFPPDAFDNTVHRCNALNGHDGARVQYHPLWSNQCIELWFLLHFAYLDSDLHRDAYYSRLSEYCENIGCGKYLKNRSDIFTVLQPKLKIAMQNAKRLEHLHADGVPSHNKPGTKVYELFEALSEYL